MTILGPGTTAPHTPGLDCREFAWSSLRLRASSNQHQGKYERRSNALVEGLCADRGKNTERTGRQKMVQHFNVIVPCEYPTPSVDTPASERPYLEVQRVRKGVGKSQRLRGGHDCEAKGALEEWSRVYLGVGSARVVAAAPSAAWAASDSDRGSGARHGSKMLRARRTFRSCKSQSGSTKREIH